MPVRRAQPPSASMNLAAPPHQSSPDSGQTGVKPSPSLPSFTRSASPSGFSNFFTKPTKWFTRTASGSRVGPTEPRSSTSTSSITSRRRPTISGPTDPRPIEAIPGPAKDVKLVGGLAGLNGRASRSVLDLSSRASTDLNGAIDNSTGSNGLGDLRSISRKGWSRSADNLAIAPPPKLTPLNTTLGMKIEQYRTGTPGTPASLNQKIYPFPSMPGTPSTPPNDYSIHQLRHAHSHSGSGSSVQGSAPPAAPQSPVGRLAPPSPQKPPRKRSFDFERAKGKSVDTAASSSSGRSSAFPFSFGGNAHPERKGSSNSIVTPTIIEPEVIPEESSKRSSQIVHRSGFINRLQNFSVSSPQLSSTKNWKAYKLVLRGSKLYFYKPPSDRAAAIRDLFPSGLVAVLEEEDEVEEEVSQPTKHREESRKKRAFWGRGRHPDLLSKDGKVEQGTFEALIHETIFGTTFAPEIVSVNRETETGSDWKDFASSVLLCLPFLVDRAKFEYEFQRCANYLISGTSDDKQDSERARVAWLVARYMAYHVTPADEDTWKTFCQDVIPSFGNDGENPQVPTTATSDGSSEKTPNSRTLSPRPADTDRPIAKSSSPRRLWAALEQEGFTREIFLKLDPETVTRSLLLYQRSILAAATPFTANVLLAESPMSPLIEFFGCDDAPHWLTHTVVTQILGPGGSGGEERASQVQNSRTHVRAEVIGRWARVGEMCRHAGDDCSWRAIMNALCAKPVARLEKAWRRVDSAALNVVRAWVYTPPASGLEGVPEPSITPWRGDGRHRALKLLEKLQEGKSNEWQCDAMYEARRVFDECYSSFNACYAQNSHRQELPEDEDTVSLVQLWKDLSKKPATTKMQRINQFMSLSFAAEPRKKGLFAPYYWSRQSNQGQQALIPLLFPEVLPTITLIDRSQLVRAKKMSSETSTVFGDPQTARPEVKCTFEPNGLIRTSGPVRHNIRRGNAFDLGGMMLPVFDGELLLCVVSNSEPGSRPVSRADEPPAGGSGNASLNRIPSIRVKSAAAGLDRKSSRARRSSLPALSQRSANVAMSGQNSEPPLYAVVQAGTLDALVHFLIHGLEGVSVSVADDNGEMALNDKKTRAVRIDRTEFAGVWWQSFRSFVSPYVFFQLLRKEYLSSSSPRESVTVDDIAQSIISRQAAIRTMSEWIHSGGGAQDALDDVELHSAIQSFLSQQSDLPNSAAQPDEILKLVKDCENERVSLLQTFTAQTMRPQMRHVPIRGSSSANTVHNFGIRPPRVEEMTPAELVNNLDAMASAAFRNVNQEDLFVTADLLEVQTADRTGWFLPREPTSVTDEVEIQTLYSYLTEIEPTSLAGEFSGDSLYRLLPPGIRSLIRAYNIIRKWAICTLVMPQLGCRLRQARMEMFLQAIEICRLRSIQPQAVLPNANSVERPCVRSFVEAVLTSALISPESRLFNRAWQGVAYARGAQAESLVSLLSNRTVEGDDSEERLTVDPAWLLERMLEIISLSDVLDSPMETPLSLVNFDKRRQLSSVVMNASSYASRGSRQRREMDRCDFERLNRIEQEFGALPIDFRALKEEAQREMAITPPVSTPSRRGTRPFQRSVLAQQEKIKRDRYMRERFLKEKKQEQQRLERKEDDLNRAMDNRYQSQPGGVKHQRSKRSMSALLNFVRPISTAFTSESSVSLRRSPAELDFVPAHKPALMLSLVESRTAAFINNERSFTFQLDTEDGGHYLLQALSKNDMNQWMQTINTAVRSHAQRRLTYMGDTSQLQVSDHIQPRPVTASRDPRAMFGVDLSFLLRREADGEELSPDTVPKVLELCLREIEERGLAEQGIYRVAGATSEVNALREALNNGQTHIDRYTDINAVCGVVKYWFRVLPETVIPEMFFEPIIEAARLPDLDERLSKIREVLHLFPRAHFSVLKRLAEHLDRVVDNEDQNHMTPDNLATVFCPNLLRAPNNNFGLIMKNMGPITVFFKALIAHMHFIFDEDEGGGEDEDEHAEAEDDEMVDDLGVPEPEEDCPPDPRFVSSPEPDDCLLQDAATRESSPET
ncbi:hypothetical protein M0805_009001 [Coniferiporia weirii]|nr:hypothetical protein M0805_009001 [Coniferiporia weirii]